METYQSYGADLSIVALHFEEPGSLLKVGRISTNVVSQFVFIRNESRNADSSVKLVLFVCGLKGAVNTTVEVRSLTFKVH